MTKTKPFETKIVKTKGMPAAVITFRERMEYLSSAVMNGGFGKTRHVLMMQVPKDYMCSDPVEEITSLANELGLPPDTVGFMTAAEIEYVFTVETMEYGGATSHALVTAGLSNQVIAGEELTGWEERHALSLERERALRKPGTINIVAVSEAPLSLSGMVNATIPITEAKTYAMRFMGYEETGTTTDAIGIFSPSGSLRKDYASTGVREGISIARAVRRAVASSLIKRGDFPVGMPEAGKEERRRLNI